MIKKFGQSGAAPVLVLVAVIGLVGFLAVASTASFKDNLFSALFPKKQSYAATVGTQWTNATGNLAGMASECGNLTSISAVPSSNTIIAGVAQKGLWGNASGTAWAQQGTGAGSAVITNRPSWIAYDPNNSAIFWEAGIYNGGGVYKTTNGGQTFQQLGTINHNDFVSVDFSDPNRQTLLAGGHEQGRMVWKSTNGGSTWTNIGLNLPAGTGFSTHPLIINSQTFIVNTETSWGGGSAGIYRTTNGGTTWTQVATQGPGGSAPLVTADGTIYWTYNGGILKSTNAGVSWTQISSGLQNVRPIEMPDGSLAAVSGSNNVVISTNGGTSWTPTGPTLPYAPWGTSPFIYSPLRKAFFISKFDCGNVVLADAIMKLDYDLGSIPTPTPTSPTTSSCGLAGAIFCDTFDTPKPGVSRAGDLDPNVWGVSRAMGGGYLENAWAPSQLVGCNSTTSVTPPNDVKICNGQLRQSVDDQHDVSVLAMYPKQPFDFAGRTGKVTFDVSNDTQGPHAAWPEFWLTDTPIPAPFSHFDSWVTFPKNGFGVRMAGNGEVGSGGICQNANNLDKRRWTVDSAIVIRNYVYEDAAFNGFSYGTQSNPALTVTPTDCVIASSGPNGGLNHVEMRIAQNQIEVWATDAGVAPTPTTLRKIASITNANLSLTRGLIWIEDAHYNASKGPCPPWTNDNPVCQTDHTFTWDNVAFDGPFTYRDFSFDALDNNAANPDGTIKLGKPVAANQTSSWNVLNMPANPQASVVRVLFNFFSFFQNSPFPTTLNVIVNGHPHAVPWPYPANDSHGFATWRTLPVQIPLTDLVAGTNVVQIGADQPIVTANVNIVLVDVPGGVPVLPGSNNAYPGVVATPGASPTPVVSPSPTPAGQSAFNGPHNLPGKLEVEDFDNGGEGVAYHDSEAANQGGVYRTSDGVDVQSTTDTGGGFNVGWTVAGEYLEYTVNVLSTGNYNISARVGSLGAGGIFHVEVDGVDKTGGMTVADTGNWQSFTDLTKTNVALTAGTHVVKIVMDTNSAGGWIGNINYLNITSASNPLPGDINGSKKVDILDYNLLITDYGATSGLGLRSDLNNSGKVDILDYNLLITNYGKSIP